MAEYIDREKAKRLLHIEYTYAAEQLLNEIPTADVVPARYGCWMKRYRSGTPAGDGWVSTCCDMWVAYKSHYCPHCGAKMDGGAK